MPSEATKRRARRDKAQGKAASTQAGEFVREEVHHVREGKHGARSPKQMIAIGLSKARRAGVKLPPPKRGTTSEATRRNAELANEAGQKENVPPTSPRRSRAVRAALAREGRRAASRRSMAKQTRQAAQRRSSADRSAAARKGAATKGPARRKAAARKAARTRASE
jgi:hypothetical protein